ncbi:helix-turn-helix transcriptional regulator [Streptomyces sp. 4N509B]|uniref:helix-turn-helix transcriptional regulator n=1 Tax=Streptomyces sp. 4N509B TaxID=3457413 RepID=UPI003FCF5E80
MAASLGDRLREARKRRGLTQKDLATAAEVSVSLIRKLEQGELRDTRMETAHRLAAALRIPTTRLINRSELPPPDPHAGETWRAVQDAVEQPPRPAGDEPPTVEGLSPLLQEARTAYFADRIEELPGLLPSLLRDADALGGDHDARLLRARILHLTATVLVQVRAFPAAEAALSRAEDDAPDGVTRAALVGTRCWLLLRQGHLSPARELATRWADETEPSRVSRSTADELATWGWTLLELASAAVRDNRPGEAADALRLARAAAVMTGRELPEGPRMNRWGPSIVAYKSAEYASIRDKPERVLALAGGLPDGPSTDSNTNRHRLDVAHAYVKTRQPDEAMAVLLGIHSAAPQWLSHQQYARDVLGTLIERRRTLTPQMRELADAIRLPL